MRRRSGGDGRRRSRGRPLLARFAAAVAAGVLAVAGLAACGASDAGAAGPRFVTPPLVRYSAVLWPVPLQLVGAEPGALLRVTARLSTDRGTWTSGASYTVPASGVLDLARARPQLAPFADADSAGLFWSLRGPKLGVEASARQWMRDSTVVTLTASSGGRVVASRRFDLVGLAAGIPVRTLYTRDLRAAVDVRTPRQTHEDVPLGTYYSAASLERPQTPAVLMFDDPSEGASSEFVAPLIAQLGASVLSIPVAASADDVRSTGIISATTVSAVFDWLDRRPDVQHDRVFVYGTGVAEQLAVWAATRFPSHVYGLFVASGTPALLCLPAAQVAPAYEDADGLRCLPRSGTVVPDAIPAIDGIEGPVVIACGESDRVLPNSCDWQRALAATRGPRAGDATIAAGGASHTVSVPPGLPIGLPAAGGQPTERARVAFWDAVGRSVLRAVLG